MWKDKALEGLEGNELRIAGLLADAIRLLRNEHGEPDRAYRLREALTFARVAASDLEDELVTAQLARGGKS